jgi:hypothetical protein
MQTSLETPAAAAVDTTIDSLATGVVDGAFHTLEIVVVSVDPSWRGEFTLLHIDGLISLPIA